MRRAYHDVKLALQCGAYDCLFSDCNLLIDFVKTIRRSDSDAVELAFYDLCS